MKTNVVSQPPVGVLGFQTIFKTSGYDNFVITINADDLLKTYYLVKLYFRKYRRFAVSAGICRSMIWALSVPIYVLTTQSKKSNFR